MNKHETIIGDYSTPQNQHDFFLLKHFPNVPLSLMRDIYQIHSEMSEEQQGDFLEASISKNWGVYDEKWKLGGVNIKYDTYDEVVKNLKEENKIEDLEEEGGALEKKE